LLFVHGDVHAVSNRRCVERRSGALCFLYAAMRALKVIEAVWSVNLEPLTDLYVALRV
jgi:hypothetical protein